MNSNGRDGKSGEHRRAKEPSTNDAMQSKITEKVVSIESKSSKMEK